MMLWPKGREGNMVQEVGGREGNMPQGVNRSTHVTRQHSKCQNQGKPANATGAMGSDEVAASLKGSMLATMKTIKILASGILQAMLEKLQLLCPTRCESRAVGEGQFVTKVMFYPYTKCQPP